MQYRPADIIHGGAARKGNKRGAKKAFAMRDSPLPLKRRNLLKSLNLYDKTAVKRTWRNGLIG